MYEELIIFSSRVKMMLAICLMSMTSLRDCMQQIIVQDRIIRSFSNSAVSRIFGVSDQCTMFTHRDEKNAAITAATTLQNVPELCSFLRMPNYSTGCLKKGIGV